MKRAIVFCLAILIVLVVSGCGSNDSSKESAKKKTTSGKKEDPRKGYYTERESLVTNTALVSYNKAIAEYTKVTPSCKNLACQAQQIDKIRKSVDGLLAASQKNTGDYNNDCAKAQTDWETYLTKYSRLWISYAKVLRGKKGTSTQEQKIASEAAFIPQELTQKQLQLLKACYTRQDNAEKDPAEAI